MSLARPLDLVDALPALRRGRMVKPSTSGYWIEREAPVGWLVVDRRELPGGRIEIIADPSGVRQRYCVLPWEHTADRDSAKLLAQAVAKVRSVPPASLGGEESELR